MSQPQKWMILGSAGMVGKAFLRKASHAVKHQILSVSRQDCNLLRQSEVESCFNFHRPDVVIMCAARVGGILANRELPANFIYENLCMSTNTIHAAYLSGVKRLLFIASSCVYPESATLPLTEKQVGSGQLEFNIEPYATAKLATLKLCQMYSRQYGVKYHSVLPCNMYGPGDHYHAQHSHVLAGLMRRMHEAKIQKLAEFLIWGTGKAQREFLHVDDFVDACFTLLQHNVVPDWINVGSGTEIPIATLAQWLQQVIGYSGSLVFDPSQPDGILRKPLDSSLIQSMGWNAQRNLQYELSACYQDFLSGRVH